MLRELKDYALILLGVTIYSIGVTVFMLPYSLTTGGVAGVASIVYYATGIEVQITYIAINVILLIAAIKELGIRFCIKTIWGVLTMTFMLWLAQRVLEIPDPAHPGKFMLPQLIGDEVFMACVLGAILEGLGVAICFQYNGSTGGTDIIAAIVHKYKPISLGVVLMLCDVVIISSCYFVFHDWFRVIFGFVMLFISSTTVDYWLRRQQQSVQFMIFSRNSEAIADAIVNTGHGATILDGIGWFTHSDRKVVVSVVRRREQVTMQRMIYKIDPYSFVCMTEASGVWGEGFDSFRAGKKASKERNIKEHVLVCASNNDAKVSMSQKTLGDYYDVRNLLQIGCDTRKEFYSVILGQEPRKRVAFIKKFFGFDAFYLTKKGTVTYIEGHYELPEHPITEFASLDEFKDFLEKKRKK
ncbi:MAG: YitT family protein [Bacteroidales bacterium]|nr:YitT family protein [Bacteroidales bacterium]